MNGLSVPAGVVTSPFAVCDAAVLEFEKLDVYQAALEFVVVADEIARVDARMSPSRHISVLNRQYVEPDPHRGG
jgi:hypothetical protein